MRYECYNDRIIVLLGGCRVILFSVFVDWRFFGGFKHAHLKWNGNGNIHARLLPINYFTMYWNMHVGPIRSKYMYSVLKIYFTSEHITVVYILIIIKTAQGLESLCFKSIYLYVGEY